MFGELSDLLSAYHVMFFNMLNSFETVGSDRICSGAVFHAFPRRLSSASFLLLLFMILETGQVLVHPHQGRATCVRAAVILLEFLWVRGIFSSSYASASLPSCSSSLSSLIR